MQKMLAKYEINRKHNVPIIIIFYDFKDTEIYIYRPIIKPMPEFSLYIKTDDILTGLSFL